MKWSLSSRARRRSLLVARALIVSAAFIYGAFSGRIAALASGSPPCGSAHPQSMVVAPDVQNPLMWGLASGASLGAFPANGFAAPTACLTVDAGRGFAQEAFLYLRMDAAKTWTWARGAGFALSSWVLLWALSWLFRAARLGLSAWRNGSGRSITSSATQPEKQA